MSLEILAMEFLSGLKDLHQHEKYIESSKKLQAAVVSTNRLMMQQQLNVHVNTLSDIILESATNITLTDEFKSLESKDKATLIRKHFALGAKTGYSESATATMQVYQELMKSTGMIFNPVAGILDEERLKGAVAGAIDHAIEDDGRLVTSMNDSFKQIIRSGNRDTIEKTSEKIEDKTGQSILVKRVTGSTDPCDFCAENSETWFRVTETDNQFKRFHDDCKCRMEMKIDNLSKEEKDFRKYDIDFSEYDLDDDFADELLFD